MSEQTGEIEYSEIEERFMDYGALGYDPEMIAMTEGTDLSGYYQMIDHNPTLLRLYNKSFAQAKYILDLKVFNLASSGDLNAIRMHNDRMVRDKMS